MDQLLHRFAVTVVVPHVNHRPVWDLNLGSEHAKSIIAEGLERFSQDALYVAWTGGKDSTTMLWLYREACKALGKRPGVGFVECVGL